MHGVAVMMEGRRAPSAASTPSPSSPPNFSLASSTLLPSPSSRRRRDCTQPHTWVEETPQGKATQFTDEGKRRTPQPREDDVGVLKSTDCERRKQSPAAAALFRVQLGCGGFHRLQKGGCCPTHLLSERRPCSGAERWLSVQLQQQMEQLGSGRPPPLLLSGLLLCLQGQRCVDDALGHPPLLRLPPVIRSPSGLACRSQVECGCVHPRARRHLRPAVKRKGGIRGSAIGLGLHCQGKEEGSSRALPLSLPRQPLCDGRQHRTTEGRGHALQLYAAAEWERQSRRIARLQPTQPPRWGRGRGRDGGGRSGSASDAALRGPPLV